MTSHPRIFTNRVTQFFLLLVVFTVASGILVPLYSDEIAIHMARARFVAEGARVVNLFPQCSLSILSEVPLALYPGAVLHSLIYFARGGLSLRALGVATGVLWVVLVWIWARRNAQHTPFGELIPAALIALNALGVFPYVLVLLRQETTMALILAACCILPLFYSLDRDASSLQILGGAVFYVVLTSYLFYLHPKAVFFSPFILVSAYYMFADTLRRFSVPLFLILLWVVAQGIGYAISAVSCPKAPIVEAATRETTLDLRQAFIDPFTFLSSALNNLTTGWSKMLQHLPVSRTFQSGWLPNAQMFFPSEVLVSFGKVLHFSTLMLIITVAVLVPVSAYRKLRSAEWRANSVLALALWTGLIGHTVIYNDTHWHFYTSGLIVPLVIMLILLLLPLCTPVTNAGYTMLRVAAYWFVTIALASVISLMTSLLPVLIRNAMVSNIDIPDQMLSVPARGSSGELSAIKDLAKRCGIDGHSKRIVVDGFSYLQFAENLQPINVLYVSGYGFGADVANVLPNFLASLDSGGVISRCDYLPEGLRLLALSNGKMCCVSKSTWSK